MTVSKLCWLCPLYPHSHQYFVHLFLAGGGGDCGHRSVHFKYFPLLFSLPCLLHLVSFRLCYVASTLCGLFWNVSFPCRRWSSTWTLRNLKRVAWVSRWLKAMTVWAVTSTTSFRTLPKAMGGCDLEIASSRWGYVQTQNRLACNVRRERDSDRKLCNCKAKTRFYRKSWVSAWGQGSTLRLLLIQVPWPCLFRKAFGMAMQVAIRLESNSGYFHDTLYSLFSPGQTRLDVSSLILLLMQLFVYLLLKYLYGPVLSP